MKQQADEKIVYCIRERQEDYDNNKGFIKPIFEETTDGLIPINIENYKDEGLIHVTSRYNEISNDKKTQLYKVGVTTSTKWLKKFENGINDNLAKYIVRYNNTIEYAKNLEVCLLIESDYPKFSMVCSSDFIPADAFFISCTNPEGKRIIIIGPLDVIPETVRDGKFEYKAHEPEFNDKLSHSAGNHRIVSKYHKNSSSVFERELIPEGFIFTVNGNEYLVNFNKLPHESAQLIDLNTNEYILKWAFNSIKNSDSSLGNQLSKLKELLDKIPTDLTIPADIFESRKKRLQHLSGRLSQIEGINLVLSDCLHSEKGKETIQNYVETRKNSLLDEYFKEELKQKSQKAETKVEEEISKKKKKLQVLNSEIKDLEGKKKDLKNSREGIEYEKMKKEMELFREEKKNVYDIGDLQTQKNMLDKDTNIARSTLKDIKSGIKTEKESYKSNLIKHKEELDVLFSNPSQDTNLKTSIPIESNFKHIEENDDKARLNVIKTLTKHLKNRGRIIEQDDVAILLTCVMQSLIVTLAGNPGSGKSSIVSELAHVLGLKQDNKYVHVQVQRGWSSDRDLVGFYNKLTNYYNPDRFGLYKLINGLQKIPLEYQFSISLLDEANLSPIEHYWSGFMGSCDGNRDSFSLDGSKQGESLALPEGLRFIATVNHDMTTEPLSPRFLDRSPVIYLEGNSISWLFNQEDTIKDDEITYYSFDDLKSLFGKNLSTKFTPDERIIIEKILKEHIFISPRKIKAMRNFTEILRKALDGNEFDMKALDYALLIHVLPLIHGQGKDYHDKIEKFNKYLSSNRLTRSQKRLETIITNGKQFNAYSYFS